METKKLCVLCGREKKSKNDKIRKIGSNKIKYLQRSFLQKGIFSHVLCLCGESRVFSVRVSDKLASCQLDFEIGSLEFLKGPSHDSRVDAFSIWM